ncbi:MAG: zinc ribbon domain-containing protein [Peptococcaceae bacterium]|nr:zinc ribbon domain-containing protein [Peptococcaceae bacterium]
MQDHLKEDLEWLAANVDYVVPEYTSQECTVCDHVDPENRNGKTFKCTRCGHKEDADINAAKNIEKRFFDAELRDCHEVFLESQFAPTKGPGTAPAKGSPEPSGVTNNHEA